MSYDLTDQERAALNAIQAYGEAPEVRRAQIILLSAEGLRTADIADTVDLSMSQVQHWRRAWRRDRMAIFPNTYTRDGQSQPASAAQDEVPENTVREAIIDAALDVDEKVLEGVVDEAFDLDEESDESAPRPGVDGPRLALDLRDTVGMEPDDSMAEAGRKALLFHFERMLLNEPGSRAGEDIEAVHDMRVATRRMRSAFQLFDPYYKSGSIKPFVRGLRRVARALGEVRDLDVSIDKAGRFVAANPDHDLEPILEGWREQRQKARRELIADLDNKRFAHFVDSFYVFLSTPGQGAKKLPISDSAMPYLVRHIAPRLIYTFFEQVRAYDSLVENASIETLHGLRIDFKRFRYALEIFADVLGPEVRKVIEETKIMQDHLGDLNDTRVVGESLRAFVDQHNKKYSGVPIFMRPDITGVVQYALAQEDEKQHLLDTFPAAWANFNRDAVHRNLALAVAVL